MTVRGTPCTTVPGGPSGPGIRDGAMTADGTGHVTYAVGDIHGELGLLEAMLAGIEADSAALGRPARVVFLGDYVDRGPDSRGVVSRVMAGPRRAGDTWVPLRGNHDDMLVRCLRGEPKGFERDWLEGQCPATLASYGLAPYERGKAPATTPELEAHLDWIECLRLHLEDGERLYVHAGVVPGAPLHKQTAEVKMWIREGFVDRDEPSGWVVHHGHTIVGPRPLCGPHRVSVDTGAYKSRRLTAAVVDGGPPRFLQASDRCGTMTFGPVDPA